MTFSLHIWKSKQKSLHFYSLWGKNCWEDAFIIVVVLTLMTQNGNGSESRPGVSKSVRLWGISSAVLAVCQCGLCKPQRGDNKEKIIVGPLLKKSIIERSDAHTYVYTCAHVHIDCIMYCIPILCFLFFNFFTSFLFKLFFYFLEPVNVTLKDPRDLWVGLN